MDSEVKGQDPIEGAAEATSSASGASSQGKSGSKKPGSKRKSSVPTGARPKKRKTSRPAGPGYTVQEGEDMLLVISNTSQYDNLAWRPKRKGARKKKPAKGKGKSICTKNKRSGVTKPTLRSPPIQGLFNPMGEATRHHPGGEVENRWGQSLPEEVLVTIFHMVVVQDGAVPFLCRVARVCHLWRTAAASPSLWRRVSMGFCWIEPGKSQLPKTEEKIKRTFKWLAENRFSQLRAFTLNHWKKNVDYAVEVLSQARTQLGSLTLSYCTGLTERTFHSLGRCHSLESINVQYSDYQVEGLVTFLEAYGSRVRQFLFTHGPRNDRLLAAISRGCCPDLEFLEINTKLDSGYCQLPICIQALQNGCPKLKTFRMLNVTPVYKKARKGLDSPAGFPLLEELCMATTSPSFTSNGDLRDLLSGSPRLRVLDLRGCSRITPLGLGALPCVELECLFWGQYSNSQLGMSSHKEDFHKLTEKWSKTLRELDVANHLYTEEDLEVAMSHLAQAADVASLRSLNLSGTRITPSALRLIIGQATALGYLNLLSCRNLPRGVKRVYRGQEDVRQLLDVLQGGGGGPHIAFPSV